MTNSRVTEVIDHSLVIMDKMSKQKRNERFGVCVWATGIAPCPLTKKIAQKLPNQNNRFCLFLYLILFNGYYQ